MKLVEWVVIWASAVALCAAPEILHAQAATSGTPQDMPWSIVESGLNDNLWQSTTYEATPSGEYLPHLHQYQEIATGLNYWDQNSGQWKPSSEIIEQSSGGAVAQQGQHMVTFASDLSAADSIDIQTPDGQLLRTRLLGLSYYDSASGQSVLIAEITNCTGVIASNQVWYDNAFSGVKAGVRYTYTRAGFDQDIVLEECPPLPEAYGLNSASTILQALTEFISPPTPEVTTDLSLVAPGFEMEDQTLLFGNLKIGKGLAFLMGTNSGAASVIKEWLNLNGRQFLVEEVPMPQIASQLESLPPSVSFNAGSNSVLNVVSTKRLLPARPMAKVNGKPMRVASLAAKKAGFVIDYTSLNTSQTNAVFQGGMTYYFTGNVNLYGTNTVFEGGTVLKYTNGVSLTVHTPVTWTGAFFHPVVMAAKDDNTVGETVSGSTGTPGTAQYAATALYFDGTSALTNLSIENLRIANATLGLALNGQSGHVLNDVQIINVGTGITATNTDLGLHNALFWNVQTNFNGSNATAKVEHLTSDTALWLNQNITNLFLTNCLLTAVTNTSSCTTDHVAMVSTNSGIFQVVGAGSHYLTTNSPFHNAGTNNLSPATLLALQQKTTYAPTVDSNTTISATEFGATVPRDTNAVPDLGYHYDPLDWVFGGVTANGNLTFDAGTAVGYFEAASGSYGIALSNHVTNTFNGTATAPCVFARYSSVQEGGNANWKSKGAPAGITTVGNSAYFAEIDAKFTHCYALVDDPGYFRDYLAQLNVHAEHCEFRAGALAGYWLGLFTTNCLFDRQSNLGSQQRSAGLFWRNCTMHGGQVFIIHSTDPTWPVWIENCAFDATTNYAMDGTNTYCNYNAFMNGAQRLIVQGSNDIVITNGFAWQTGPLGAYYEPPLPGNPLIDAGSVTADVVGLYHFTTQTNQAIEGFSKVDIGYHYVALDASGNPIDTNGDGIPDYLEDANGNGIFDSGDLGNWLINPWNGLNFVNGLQVFTPLK